MGANLFLQFIINGVLWIAAAIGTFFTAAAGSISIITALSIRKFLIAVAAVAAMTLLFTGMVAAIANGMSGIASYVGIPVWVSSAIGLVLPAHYKVFIGAAIAGRFIRVGYDFANLKLRVFYGA